MKKLETNLIFVSCIAFAALCFLAAGARYVSTGNVETVVSSPESLDFVERRESDGLHRLCRVWRHDETGRLSISNTAIRCTDWQ